MRRLRFVVALAALAWTAAPSVHVTPAPVAALSFATATTAPSVRVAWPATAEANVTFKRGQRLVLAGDSQQTVTYAWYPAWVIWVNSQFTVLPARSNAARSTGTGARSTGNAARDAGFTPPTSIVVAPMGVSGQKTAELDAATQTQIIDEHPDAVLIATGGNDMLAGVPANAFEISLTSVVTKIQTAYPGIPIGIMSTYFIGDAWNTGPVWNNGATDAQIVAYDLKKAAVALAKGCTFIDTHTPFLTWEAANNPSKLSSGVAGQDIYHLNATGQAAISPMVQPYITINQAWP